MLHARIFADSVSFVDISNFRVEGMRVTVTPGWRYQPCDVAVMYGLANPSRRSKQGLLRNALYREHTGPIVVIESSLIGRSFKKRLPGWLAAIRKHPLRPRQIHPYYRLAVGGALGDDADFGAENSPPDRWERMKAEFGIELKPYRTQGDHIVVVGQVPMDASLRGVDVNEWLQEAVRLIRSINSRPILIRLHPSTRWRYHEQVRQSFAGTPGITISAGDRPLAEDLAGAWVCVTLSSGAAIDALMEGIPPICLSPASLAFKICSQKIAEVEQPKMPEREQFLRDLCYSQWSPRELADGTAWRHIWPIVERVLTGAAGERRSADASAEINPAGSHAPPQRPSAVRRRFGRIGPRQSLDTGKGDAQHWKSSLARWNALARVLPNSPRAMFGRGKALFHLQRYEEAESTFARLRALHPDITVAHEGFARAAEKSGQWTRALEGWTAATLLEPDRLVPLRGKAKAEAALGLDDAAEASFMRLSRIHPSSQAGFRGAAGLAEKRGDWPRALAIYDELWARFADVDAIRQKASILIRLQRIEEARQIADVLKPPAGPALTYLLAASPVYEHLHDWPAMNQLLQRHEAEILSDGRLVRTYVNMLVRLGRMDEALRLTDRSSADIDEARNLRVATLIHARRYDEADAILAGILAGESFSGLRVELLAPLVTAAWEAGGASLARSIVDRIESEAPRNRTGEVLRLLVPFHRLRLWFLEGLFSSPPRLEPPVILPEKAVASLVDQWRALPEAAFGYDFTREVCALIGELRAASPVFPDTSFDLRDALEVALRIVRAVDELQPLSLVRLGDGEGVLLPYRTEYRHFQQADRSATKRAWWGDEADVEMEEIARHLKEAAIGSTIVGIPDLYRICLTLLSRSASDITEGGRSARGILAVIDYVKTELAANVQVVTSCHIHQSFSYWGLWDLLLPRIGRLSLVTCQEKLAELLSSKYGVTIDAVHLIPPEQKYARGFASARTGRHYPLVFEELRGKLAEAEPGQVFLVAAGVLGKVYCTWIKQAGGIAIDIGSAADFWCGHETRSIADGGNYRSPAGTAESMRQLLAGHTRFGILLGTPPAGAARSYDGADELAAGRMP